MYFALVSTFWYILNQVTGKKSIEFFRLRIQRGFPLTSEFSDVVGKQKSGSGWVPESTFRVQVGFGDQHFGDVSLVFLGFRGVLR